MKNKDAFYYACIDLVLINLLLASINIDCKEMYFLNENILLMKYEQQMKWFSNIIPMKQENSQRTNLKIRSKSTSNLKDFGYPSYPMRWVGPRNPEST